MASNLSCNIDASMWASWPLPMFPEIPPDIPPAIPLFMPGAMMSSGWCWIAVFDRGSVDWPTSASDGDEENACWTLASTWACWSRSHSCSFSVCTLFGSSWEILPTRMFFCCLTNLKCSNPTLVWPSHSHSRIRRWSLLVHGVRRLLSNWGLLRNGLDNRLGVRNSVHSENKSYLQFMRIWMKTLIGTVQFLRCTTAGAALQFPVVTIHYLVEDGPWYALLDRRSS